MAEIDLSQMNVVIGIAENAVLASYDGCVVRRGRAIKRFAKLTRNAKATSASTTGIQFIGSRLKTTNDPKYVVGDILIYNAGHGNAEFTLTVVNPHFGTIGRHKYWGVDERGGAHAVYEREVRRIKRTPMIAFGRNR